MTTQDQPGHRDLDQDAALRTILEGTATETGEKFFRALVQNLAKALGTHGAWVTEYLSESRRLRARAFWMGGSWIEDYEIAIDGTPCEKVIETKNLVHHPDKIFDLYPDDADLQDSSLVSYLGVPLMDVDGEVLGHLAVIDTRPMPEEPRFLALFRIFAARASAEVQRLRAEAQVREREEKLGRLISSAMDAIIELDSALIVTGMNTAAEKTFGCVESDVVGSDFTRFLSSADREKLLGLINDLDARPEGQRYLCIPGGLTAVYESGEEFSAEATLSRFEVQRQTFYTLILRNVNERIEAEEKIRSLTEQTEYLKEEIKSLHDFEAIVGESKPLQDVLEDVRKVAVTDATVLILGETGTGKELFARAIHAKSVRSEKPLIKVNCGTIPENLVESELFGHVKGAFTGATDAREGRFTLADGGTIFLDEIGELSLDLQVKLLRILQEGEFEAVGSSETRKVDVRILAATNRDLEEEVAEGLFREDLYYRLNVFPIHIPPLRERGNDIALLATQFTERCAQTMGRTVPPLSPKCIQRLMAYAWPGNVRELENIIERALITSTDGCLNLDRALPESTVSGASSAEPSASSAEPSPIHTAQQLQELESANIVRALEKAEWRVSGENGAAEILGMKPSTLSSRMKVLGISRPS